MSSRPEQRVRQRQRRNQRSDLAARVIAAIPAIAFAIFIVWYGGWVFVAGLALLGTLALKELYNLMRRAGPVDIAGFIGLWALLVAALEGDQFQILLALVVTVPVTFFFALARRRRADVSWGIAVTLFGVVWVGVALAHAVLIRELPHGGAIVVDVLIGTFIGDTAAYLGGRAFGRRPLAPGISPNKTLEGLLCGVVGGTFAFWFFAYAWQDAGRGGFWTHGDALLVGVAVALAAPIGDLFESLVKRDLDVKDTGKFFGAHGGVLDRLDAVFFTAVTAYYVAVAVG